MPQPYALTAPDWNAISATTVVANVELATPTRALVKTDSDELFIELGQSGMRLKGSRQRNYDYGILLNQTSALPLSVENKDSVSFVRSELFSVRIEHAPFAFVLYDAEQRVVARSATDGHFVRRYRVPPLAKTEQGWFLSLDLRSDESIYGLGEKWGALNKRGQLLRSYNVDALGVNAEVSYKNTPFAWSPDGWGLFTHTPSPVTHSVGHPSWSQRSYVSLIEDNCLDVFILAAGQSDNKAATLIQHYTDLTGSAPMPPNWSGGVILSKAYYQNPSELLEVAHEVRKRNMPCDTITIDGRAWQDTATRFAFEWDKTRWADPKPVLDELKELGFKICIWEYPLISVNHEWFKMFAGNGWLLKDKRTGEAYQYDWDQQAFGRVLSPLPKSGIVDFTNPAAYEFWKDAHKPLFELGIDMIKADFGEQLEDDNMLAHNGETGHKLHNVYAFLYNKCVFEAAQQYSKNGSFLFSRAAWSGSQRFNSQWGGDPQADWEGMIGNIRGGLSWGLSGAPFYATDVGGFYKDTRDDALYVRWAQAGIFSAHFRLHGIGPREPWSYSDEANAAVMKVLDLRYRLQAYLQTTMNDATQTGLPVQRPMVLAFPNEKQAWAFENQFMFGEDMLIAPCFDPDGRVEFYLPEGQWRKFDLDKQDDELASGGKVYKRKLSLNEMAVYVRDGTQIPLNESALNTVDIAQDEMGVFKASSNWPTL